MTAGSAPHQPATAQQPATAHMPSKAGLAAEGGPRQGPAWMPREGATPEGSMDPAWGSLDPAFASDPDSGKGWDGTQAGTEGGERLLQPKRRPRRPGVAAALGSAEGMLQAYGSGQGQGGRVSGGDTGRNVSGTRSENVVLVRPAGTAEAEWQAAGFRAYQSNSFPAECAARSRLLDDIPVSLSGSLSGSGVQLGPTGRQPSLLRTSSKHAPPAMPPADPGAATSSSTGMGVGAIIKDGELGDSGCSGEGFVSLSGYRPSSLRVRQARPASAALAGAAGSVASPQLLLLRGSGPSPRAPASPTPPRSVSLSAYRPDPASGSRSHALPVDAAGYSREALLLGLEEELEGQGHARSGEDGGWCRGMPTQVST